MVLWNFNVLVFRVWAVVKVVIDFFTLINILCNINILQLFTLDPLIKASLFSLHVYWVFWVSISQKVYITINFLFLRGCGCSACTYVCAPWLSSPRRPEEGIRSLVLGSQTVVNHCVGAGNQTQFSARAASDLVLSHLTSEYGTDSGCVANVHHSYLGIGKVLCADCRLRTLPCRSNGSHLQIGPVSKALVYRNTWMEACPSDTLFRLLAKGTGILFGVPEIPF